MRQPLIAVAFALGLCDAAPATQTTFTYGSGNVTCGAWIRSKADDPEMYSVRHVWVAGFLSALSYVRGGNVAGGPDLEGIYQFIDNFCGARPLASLREATVAAVAEANRQ